MPGYLAALTIILMMAMVLARAMMMKRKGITVIHFGKIDKKDFLIPPIALLYFYTIFAAAFNWPLISSQEFFTSKALAWFGVLLCFLGLSLLLASLISFGRSFRVGIDMDHPAKLVTTGIFARSRNPIYVAFWIILLGQFLVFSNWILLVYLIAATWLFHRQVLREEEFLQSYYGEEYTAYCNHVRRYF